VAFFEWSDSLSVSYHLIDTDHKRLIELINKLCETSESAHNDTARILPVMDELIAYTRTHFVHEETLMRKTAYPQFIPHKIEHDRLITQIEDLRKRFEAGQIGLSPDTLVYMRTWLCDHITQIDRTLGAWLVKYAPLNPSEASGH